MPPPPTIRFPPPIRGRGVGRQGGERRLSARGGATFDPAGGGQKKLSGEDGGGGHGQNSYQIVEKGQNFEFCR